MINAKSGSGDASSRQPMVGPMKSLAIRIMPSHAARSEAPSDGSGSVDSEACAVVTRREQCEDDVRAVPSTASKVSTMQWREGKRRHPFRRCCYSTSAVTCRLVAVLVAVAIGAVWAPSALLAKQELVSTSESQLASSVEQASKELLGYLQVASSHAEVFGRMYNISFASAPEAAPAGFMGSFGDGAWALLKQAPALSSVLLAQARHPNLTNLDDPGCDVDVALIAATYKANLNNWTTGAGMTSPESTRQCATNFSDRLSEEACRIRAEQLGLNVTDPLYAFAGNYSETGCFAYASGPWQGSAFYGFSSAGGEVQSEAELSSINESSKYRLDTCLEVDVAPSSSQCVTSFSDRFGEQACRIKAEQLGLERGGQGFDFSDPPDSETGCFAYASGPWRGLAFYGNASAGGEVQNEAELTNIPPGTSMYRIDTCLAHDAAPPGMARMNNVIGDGDLLDPLGYESLKFFKNCSAWLGQGENLWSMQNLPGNWSRRDSGVRRAVWLPGTVVAGSGASQALYKKVFFPLEGPHWANESAFGAVSIRVGSRTISGDDDSTVSLLDILRGVTSLTDRDTLLFALTAEGDLLASSVEGQEVELIDPANNNILGLIPGDSDSVEGPVRDVARQLIDAYCTIDATGLRRCDWASAAISSNGQMHGYYVACKVVVDSQASGLDMLLVNMLSAEEISAPARALNEQLAATSGLLFVVACLLALVLGRVLTSPFQQARDNMFLLGDMKVEQALQLNGGRRSCDFTEVSDLRLSFYHAASCLKAWSDHEVANRRHLEVERTRRIQRTVERAVRGAGQLVHPMVLISADAFSKLEQLTSYEELRNSGKLVFLDDEDSLAVFKATSSIVFLSHQWLASGFPDNATKTHLNAMKSAVRSVASHLGASGEDRYAWDNVYIWVDYCSVAQDHRGLQMLAIRSLPIYASSADAFVIVAPPAEHQNSKRCDLNTYNARGWCRAEMLAKVCSSGLRNFFLFEGGGALEPITEERLLSLSMYVFEGDFSCCQQKHAKSCCDKEALVEPVLGLYSLVLRQIRANANCKNMEPIMKHIRDNKERFFPTLYSFQAEGVGAEERELFGPLVGATEAYVEELSLPECTVSFHSWQRRQQSGGQLAA
mmetsp:Transcript_55583/g.154799  ORF Transcript_55583/g.154799 Transcript_55583/m.154799 type:complete len:1117 (-) Transcript_55583:152-3502(-)